MKSFVRNPETADMHMFAFCKGKLSHYGRLNSQGGHSVDVVDSKKTGRVNYDFIYVVFDTKSDIYSSYLKSGTFRCLKKNA